MSEHPYREEKRTLIGFWMEIHRKPGKGHDEVISKDTLVVGLSRANIPFARENKYAVK